MRPAYYPDEEKPFPRLIAPIVAAPLGLVRHPAKSLDLVRVDQGRPARPQPRPKRRLRRPRQVLKKGGWVPVSYETEDIETCIRLNKGGADIREDRTRKGRNLFLEAKPAQRA